MVILSYMLVPEVVGILLEDIVWPVLKCILHVVAERS